MKKLFFLTLNKSKDNADYVIKFCATATKYKSFFTKI